MSQDLSTGVPRPGRRAAKATVLMRGLPQFVRMLAPLLSCEELRFEPSGKRRDFSTLCRFLRASAVYYIGGSAARSRLANIARLLRKPVVMHWVGTDVLNALATHASRRVDWQLVQHCKHWAEVPWTAEELCSMGIKAEVVPLASTSFPRVALPLPREFRILTYLGERPWFYGFENLRRLARDFPQVQIGVVGNCGLDQQDLPENMKLLGFVHNMADEYVKSTLLIRMTQHDGLSFMVLEALAHGRHVIWTYPFEGTLQAADYEMLREHVQQLLSQHRARQLKINEIGAQYVWREYDPERVAANLRRRIMEVITPRRG